MANPPSLPSPTYALFAQAMEERRLVVCAYHGLRRELCPVVLGWSEGQERVLAYQVGGASSRPLTTGGDALALHAPE
jgi:hypothetical protein